MTSLKVQYADEIAEAMLKTLDDAEFSSMFKTASLDKIAGAAFTAFKTDIDAEVASRKTGGQSKDYNEIYTQHLSALEGEENTEPGTITKAREYISTASQTPGARQPGNVMPADDVCACTCKDKVETCEVCGKKVASEFALAHLSKLANALDNRGFNQIADIIDETIEKISKNK
jgi:hypothetical protein